MIPIEKYAQGYRDLDPIDLGSVDDRIPISFIVGTEDTLCTPEVGERIYDEFSNADKHITYWPWDHGEFARNGSDEFTDHIAELIEKDQGDVSVWETLDILPLFGFDEASNLLATSAVALTSLALAF